MGDRSRTDAEQRSDVRLLHSQQTGIRSGPGQSAAADDQFGQADDPRMAAPAGIEGHDIVRHEESLRQRLHLHQVRAHTQHTPVLHAAGRKRRTAHQGPRQRRMVRRRHDRIRSGNRFQPVAASDKRLQPLGRDRPIQGAAARQRRPVALLLRKHAGKRQAQMAGRVGRQPAHILSGRQRPRRSGIPRRQALRHLYRSGGILYLEHRGKPRKRYDLLPVHARQECRRRLQCGTQFPLQAHDALPRQRERRGLAYRLSGGPRHLRPQSLLHLLSVRSLDDASGEDQRQTRRKSESRNRGEQLGALPSRRRVRILPRRGLHPERKPHCGQCRQCGSRPPEDQRRPVERISVAGSDPHQLDRTRQIFLERLQLLLLASERLRNGPVGRKSGGIRPRAAASPRERAGAPRIPGVRAFEKRHDRRWEQRRLHRHDRRDEREDRPADSVLHQSIAAGKYDRIFGQQPLFFIQTLGKGETDRPAGGALRTYGGHRNDIPSPPRHQPQGHLPPSQQRQAVQRGAHTP